MCGRPVTGNGMDMSTFGLVAAGSGSVAAITGCRTAGNNADRTGIMNLGTGSAKRRLAGLKSELRVGVISDTHGLLRPEVRAFLSGSDYIIHGGDVGDPAILEELEALAPVIAVKGNNDDEPWARG